MTLLHPHPKKGKSPQKGQAKKGKSLHSREVQAN